MNYVVAPYLLIRFSYRVYYGTITQCAELHKLVT
jgi:hypothetical protein